MESNKLVDGLENFFQKDMNIKEDLLKIAPSEIDDLTEEQRIEYIDKLYESIRDFKGDFISSLRGLDISEEVMDAVSRYFDRLTEKFAIGKYYSGITSDIYQKGFSDMDLQLVEEVKSTLVGYTYGGKNVVQLIDKANTINELLHIIHQYIMNNDKLLQSLPEIASKENKNEYSITLRGKKTEISDGIFQGFPKDLDVGITDIVSLNDKVIMMVRDRGHALTIDITPSQDKVLVRYFVPKLCNREMVEALPGIDREHITSSGASGCFECSREELSGKLVDFIGRVPTDFDIPGLFNTVNNKEVNNAEENLTSVIGDDKKEDVFLKDVQAEDVITENEKVSIFSSDDAKEVALQKGPEGRNVTRIKMLHKKIKDLIMNLKNRFKRNNEEENKDDKSERD